MNEQRGDKRSSGFTLIELIAAIGIIGLLAAMTLGAVKFAGQKSDRIKATGDLKAIEQGLIKFKNYYGYYPPTPVEFRGKPELYICAMLWYVPRGADPEVYPAFLEMPGWRDANSADGDQARIIRSWDPDKYGLYDPWGDPYIYEPILADGQIVTSPGDLSSAPVGYRLYSYGGDTDGTNEDQWIYSGKVK